MLAYVGIDDTDGKNRRVAGSGIGTGRLARKVAGHLNLLGKVKGVVRHQLPRLSTINYTSNNSAKSIIIDVPGKPSADKIRQILEVVTSTVKELSLEGSNSGVALLIGKPDSKVVTLANKINMRKLRNTKF